MQLESILNKQLSDNLVERLRVAPFRRLSDRPEQGITPKILCQALHIDRMSGAARPLIGEGPTAYMMHSVDSAKREIDSLYSSGIRRVYLGPELTGRDGLDPQQRLDAFVEIVAAMRTALGDTFELIVDPAGLCMRKDLRWGVTNTEGKLDVEATLTLLGKAAWRLADAGVNSLMTIGRLNCEVEVVRSAAAHSNRNVSVLSFSTNSETTSAYFETTKHDVTRSRTGQKILVGNGTEMLIRAISDFGEGSDVIVQKPIEAFHLLATLRLLASGQLSVSTFLDMTPGARELLENNPTLKPAFDRGSVKLQDRSTPLKTGTYEVSGTFSTIQMLAQKYGEELAWSLQDEIMQNAASAAGESLDIMITRNASWYVRLQERIESRRALAAQ